jgi:hypothetical protein
MVGGQEAHTTHPNPIGSLLLARRAAIWLFAGASYSVLDTGVLALEARHHDA